MWKSNTSDVYVATRTLGGSMKVSLHASGRCHIRAPDPQQWRGNGEPPRFLDVWAVDVSAQYVFPFSVVFPEQELRSANWAAHRDKGTVWVTAEHGKGVEIGIFLMRVTGDVTAGLNAAGWLRTIVDAPLPDGRRLIVAAGEVTLPASKLTELEAIQTTAQDAIARSRRTPDNPRMVLLAGPNEHRVRKFVEAAVYRKA